MKRGKATKRIVIGVITIAVLIGATLLGERWSTKGIRRGPQAVAKRSIQFKKTEKSLGDFTLLDHEGTIQMLYRNWDAKVVVIIGQVNGCPIIQKYAQRLRELKQKFEPQRVRFFFINPNPNDDRKSIIKEANEYQFGIPILLDPSQIVTRELGLDRSSEVAVISTESWEIVYRGPIDDQLNYENNRRATREAPLELALSAQLAGQPVEPAKFLSKGCAFSFEKRPKISFQNDIAPVLIEKCLNCHSKQGPFPPVLTSYESFKNWSAMIRETLFTDRMPPFSADPLYGSFRNDISLSPEQKGLLVSWIDAGLPRDTADNPLADENVPRRKYGMGKIKPVYTASMPKVMNVPADGTVEYQYFQLGGPVPRDLWISAFHTTSTNPRQLHHESLMITAQPLEFFQSVAQPKRDEKLAESNMDGDIPIYTLKEIMKQEYIDEKFMRFQVWAAGRPKVTFAQPGTSYFIPKGYYLILEAHYMGTGKPETEQTTIDFYGGTERKGRKVLHAHMLKKLTLDIPAGTKKYVERTVPWPIKKDIELMGMMGHLHMRGRATRLMVQEADGSEHIIGSIPNYYYAWQVGSGLAFAEPIKVKKGSKLIGECEYDNSPQNPNNPDPTKVVHFGQTVDRTEMCLLHLSYVHAD